MEGVHRYKLIRNFYRLVGELLTERLVDEYRIGGQEAAFERPLNINGVRTFFYDNFKMKFFNRKYGLVIALGT